MNAKQKKVIEKGFNSLSSTLGEDNATYFIDYLLQENMHFAQLKTFSQQLTEERIAKEEAKKPPKKVIASLSKEEYKKVLDEYGTFLTKQNIRYNNYSGFCLFMSGDSHEYVVYVRHGYPSDGLELNVYVGRVFCSQVRPVRRIEKNMQLTFPDYRIYEEDYHKYSHEFSVYIDINYESIEQLHEEVIKLVDVADRCKAIAIEEVGKGNFE